MKNNVVLFLGNGFWLSLSSKNKNNFTNYTNFVKWKLNKYKLNNEIGILKSNFFTVWEKLFFLCAKYEQISGEELFYDIERYISSSFKIVSGYIGLDNYQYKLESKYNFWQNFYTTLQSRISSNRRCANYFESIENDVNKIVKNDKKYKLFSLENKASDDIAKILSNIYYDGYNISEEIISNLYNWLKKELSAFEDSFEQFLLDIKDTFVKDEIIAKLTKLYLLSCGNITNYVSNNKHKTNADSAKLISSNINLYLVDFNYFNIYDEYEKSIFNLNGSKPCSNIIYRKPKMHSENSDKNVFGYSNIHGQINDKSHHIIFGIDDHFNEQDNYSNNAFTFSKSYRQVYEHDEWRNQMHSLEWEIIPPEDKNSNLNLCFYGLSLSKVDYSYYQSIFDKYNLYESNVTLIFMFLRGPDSEPEKFKKEVYQNAYKLLKDYGNTMNNKDHGKNLLTKLRLENRIHFIEI